MNSTSILDGAGGKDVDDSAAVQAMHNMLDRYSTDLPAHHPSDQAVDGLPLKERILVTGVTSALGSAILSHLSEMPEMDTVYAVDVTIMDGASLKERQKEILLERGYDSEAILASSRIQLFEGDLSEANLGLSREVYDELRNSITHVIHIPQPANTNGTLKQYENSVKGLRNLIDSALTSPLTTPPRVILLSSDKVLRHVDRTAEVSEVFVDAKIAVGSGYSESLWVSEQILALVSHKTSLSALSIRTSQNAGSRNGAWDTRDWVPSLIKSSIHVGCIPMFSESVSWLEVDAIAHAVLEARNMPSNFSPLHLAHPRPVSWKTLLKPLVKRYSLQPVTFAMWYTRLAQSAQWDAHHQPAADTNVSGDTVVSNPALQFLEIFSTCNEANLKLVQEGKLFAEAMGLPHLDVTKSKTIAAKGSLSPERLKSLGPEDAMRWVAYWEKVGFLPKA